MAGQSMIMGEAFGKSYQYGKRKISSMTNEEFNKLDAKQLSEQLVTDYTNMIPALSKAVKESDKFQSVVIQEIGDIIKKLPSDIQKVIFTDTDANSDSTGTALGIGG